MESSQKIERKILLTSFIMGSFFAIVEFFTAIYTNSQSMLTDAAYDASELIVISLTLFLVPLFHKPITERRPFGYSQVESVFVVIKNFTMIAITITLLVDTTQVLLSAGNHIDSGFIASFQLVLGTISLFVLAAMKRMNRLITSPIVDTEIYGWRLDCYYSFGMAAAFFGAKLLKEFGFHSVLPYFDSIIAILIVGFMLPQTIKMTTESIKSMFLFSPDVETTDSVKELSNKVLELYHYQIENYDIYRTGRILWVDIFISTREEYLSMLDFYTASEELQKNLSEQFDNCESQLVIQTRREAKQ